MVEHGEKNRKYFASLEKKRSETKLISRLKIYNKINTNQTEILSETELFFVKISIINGKWDTHLIFFFFGDSILKLKNFYKNSCEGHITEVECINALKHEK